MNSNLNKVKTKITKKELAIGTYVIGNNVMTSEILCYCGFDMIMIDGEHCPIDNKDIDLNVMTIRNLGVAPFVRIPWNDPVLAKPVLEMGPAGIIFPFIKTKEEAKLAVSSCKYPPNGIRGFGPLRANNYSMMSDGEYLEMSKKEPWIVLQIEHIDGINNLKEIIKVEGVDSIFIGPYDLSGSIGLLCQTRHSKVDKLINKIAEICIEADIPFGTCTNSSEENIKYWINKGISWIFLDGDLSFLLNGGISAYKRTNKIFYKLKNN